MSNHQESNYLNLLQKIKEEGVFVGDRTGTGCYSLFGETLRFDLSEGFPLMTTKTINFNNIVGELLWFLSGKVDLPSLRKYSCKPAGAHTIWSDDFEKFWEQRGRSKSIKEDEWLGYIYGRQWRNGEDGHDQIEQLLEDLHSVVHGDMTKARRLIVQSWNPYDHTAGDKEWAALPACHTDFQLLVRDGKLNLKFNMRSSDAFLGLPYNIASYATLCHIFAKMVGLQVGELWCTMVDVHLYSNHLEAVETQLDRVPTEFGKLVLPEFQLIEDLVKMDASYFQVVGYNPQGFIKAQQAS